MNLLASLEAAGIDLRKTGKQGEYITECPQCQKKKLAINVEKQRWQCWKCNSGGGVFALSKWLGIKLSPDQSSNFSHLRNKYIETPKLQDKPYQDVECVLPKDYISLSNSSGVLGQKALEFVMNRGVSPEMIEKWHLGYCATGIYAKMIVIPVEDTDGVIRTFQTRRYWGNGNKNMNPYNVDKLVYNLRHAQGYPGLIVVEGPWDAMATHSRMSCDNISSTALMGHSCNSVQARQIAQFLKPEFTWIALDPDVTEEEREKVASALIAEGLPNVEILHPSKDPDEILHDEFVILINDGTKPTRRRIPRV